MNKYNSEDYFTVRERGTHKKICDCGSFEDARMVMNLDTPNREIIKNKILMDQVIDIETPKALPTNEIVVNMDGGVGGSWMEVSEEEFDKMFPLHPVVKKKKQLNQSDAEVFVP